MDVNQRNRESLRWLVLDICNRSRPIGVVDVLLLSIIAEILIYTTKEMLRSEIQYLELSGLISVDRQRSGEIWVCQLLPMGVNLCEYTIDCPVGIARPEKYWK